MGKINKVSVIIPTFNRSKFLKNAIHSIQSQTYKNIEIIVSDDGSVPIKWYKNEYKYIQNLIKEYKKDTNK